MYLVLHFQRIQSVQHEIKSVPLLHYSALCDLPETSKKNFKKEFGNFFSIFSFLRAFVVSSCRKRGFRVFLSLRYGADLGRSRLVLLNVLLQRFLSFRLFNMNVYNVQYVCSEC